MKMKILIYGGGWIGNILNDHFKTLGWDSYISDKIIGLTPEVILEEEIQRCDVVINAFAKTQIDWCEKNKVETFKHNTIYAKYLAELAKRFNKKYVFFSSACIFESTGPTDIKDENSIPNPKCFYSLTKWMAEELISEVNPESLILRIRLPLSEKSHPRNTINKILTYPYLNDSQETVTVIEDMLGPLTKLLEEKKSGIFHLVNAGTISPHEIGDIFHSPHKVWTKEEQDKLLKEQGRARRVNTFATSIKVPLLPDIKERIKTIKQIYG